MSFTTKMNFDFTGKVVLTTGSSGGIGAGIAKLFAQLGAYVVITGRNTDKIQSVANECQQLSPKNLKPLQVVADICKDNELQDLLTKTIEKYGQLDVLVNNAGIAVMAPITLPNFMQVYDTGISANLRPHVQLSHLAVPYLQKTNGNIINISGIISLAPMKYSLPMSISKAGIDIMTRVLALELGPNIRVNAINSGYVKTDIGNDLDPTIAQALVKQAIDRTPMKRVGQPQDIAQGVAYLASDQAQFVTGANFVIDGGIVHNAGGMV
ncbi:3-oxoacyl-[acyl-carrier-protein] reductase FabG-like [Oppia nitens]|uniref:3-oxoacyl-[acyl-carrier-protein] reductase FabG-like n=1 Tax=Oppia nitens TaxID=1686743 RepID=UPI0023DCB844|nr:3-oxoacyl-[acyl-carrier-protein] reductase FabG-like [Oppia nitens]